MNISQERKLQKVQLWWKSGCGQLCLHCACCSDDVAKATEASLSLGGRKLLTVVAQRKALKEKRATCISDHTAANSQ